jgi:hypothetical protein
MDYIPRSIKSSINLHKGNLSSFKSNLNVKPNKLNDSKSITKFTLISEIN